MAVLQAAVLDLEDKIQAGAAELLRCRSQHDKAEARRVALEASCVVVPA